MKVDKLEIFLGCLTAFIFVGYFFMFVGNLQTAHITCEDDQCTAVTKILFLNSTPVKTFDPADVHEVLVTIDEKDDAGKAPEPVSLSITVVFHDRSYQKLATTSDELEITTAADELSAYVEEPQGDELSIPLGPTGYEKWKFFTGLAFLTLLVATFVIPYKFGPF